MWLKKKFILIGLLTLVVLGGTLGGIAVAQANDNGSNTTSQADNTTRMSALLEKVATIYQQNTGVTINADELAKAFTQAGKEMCNTAMDKFLDNLVTKGQITQDQANQFKAWLDAKPNIDISPGFNGLFNRMGRMGKMGGMSRLWEVPDTSTSAAN
jgi:hypothetical protein